MEANSQAGENCEKTEGATSTAVFLVRHTGKCLVTFLVTNFHAELQGRIQDFSYVSQRSRVVRGACSPRKFLIFEPQKRHLQHSEGSFNIKFTS